MLRSLGNGSAQFSVAETSHLRALGPAGWQLFLDSEGCSAVVQQKLIELDLLDTLSREARRAVQRRALEEAQRVLAVRHQIAELARIGRKRSWRIALLRGGVGVAESSDVLHLADLDVVTAPDDAHDLAHELRSVGYTSAPDETLHLLPPGDVAGAVPISIEGGWPQPHGVEQAWKCSRVVRQCPPLERPGDADHLWDVLIHSVEHHPHRRGRLRDALLMWRVLAACRDDEVDVVERRIAAHASSGALERALAFVRRLNSGDTAEGFVIEAAERYASRALDSVVPLQPWIPDALLTPAVKYLAATARLAAENALKRER